MYCMCGALDVCEEGKKKGKGLKWQTLPFLHSVEYQSRKIWIVEIGMLWRFSQDDMYVVLIRIDQ